MLGAAWKYATGSGSDRKDNKGRAAKTEDGGRKVESSITLYIVAMDDHKIKRAVKSIDDFINEEFYSEVNKIFGNIYMFKSSHSLLFHDNKNRICHRYTHEIPAPEPFLFRHGAQWGGGGGFL